MNQTEKQKHISVGVTGASGAQYGLTLIKQLTRYYQQVHVMISDAGRVVLATELDCVLAKSPQKAEAWLNSYAGCEADQIKVYSKDNWYSPVASGSSAPKQMVICPASMGCVSAIAQGASNNLMERAADVVIKEKGQLILVPREMPFSTIHLSNMLALSQAGVTIMPAAPGFYHKPQSIEDLVNFVVARILSHLGIESDLHQAWGY